MFHKGQRVQTSLGTGTIRGFEVFDGKGWPLPPVDADPENGYRITVELDHPENWQASEHTPHPYIFRSEISEFKGES